MTEHKQQGVAQPMGEILPTGPDAIRRAGAALRAGGLVGMPTETVYGLAADATSAAAVARIYEAKGRPLFNPLISHVASLAEARLHGILDGSAERLAAAFWPGPLTLVVPLHPSSAISDLARAGLDTVALRVPAHPDALAIIAAAGAPLAAPSANRSGRISPTTARAVVDELGRKVDLVVDGGPCGVGVESTVVACGSGKMLLLRPGGIVRDDIEAAAGRALDDASVESHAPRSPGLLASHYSPFAPLHMNVTTPPANHAVLTFGKQEIDLNMHRGPVINLSKTGDLREAAVRLFSALRELDATNPPAISVMPVPESGLGEAINDRIRRACVPPISQWSV